MSFGQNIDELVENSTNGLHAMHHTWERVRIGEIAALVNGFAFKSSGFNDKVGTPIVRIRDVTKGEPGTFYRGSVDDPKMTFIEDGQIAIGMDGDFNCRIWKGGHALLNQRVCTLEAHEEYYSQEFLAFALPGYLKLINDHTSSITVKHLSSLTVRDIPLPLPPLNEQRRIVEKIETLFTRLDKGEEALRTAQKLLARYRQSVLKAAVTGQLTADWRAANAHRLEHGPRDRACSGSRVRAQSYRHRTGRGRADRRCPEHGPQDRACLAPRVRAQAYRHRTGRGRADCRGPGDGAQDRACSGSRVRAQPHRRGTGRPRPFQRGPESSAHD